MSFASLRKVRNYREAKTKLEGQYQALKLSLFSEEVDEQEDVDVAKAFELLVEMDHLFYNFNALKSYFEVSKVPLKFDEEQLIYDMTKFQDKIEKKIPIAELVSVIPNLAILRREFRENAKEGGKIAHQLMMSTADLSNLFESDSPLDLSYPVLHYPQNEPEAHYLLTQPIYLEIPSESPRDKIQTPISVNVPSKSPSITVVSSKSLSPQPSTQPSVAPAQLAPAPSSKAKSSSQAALAPTSQPKSSPLARTVPPSGQKESTKIPSTTAEKSTYTPSTKSTKPSNKPYESSLSKLDSWTQDYTEWLFQLYIPVDRGTDSNIIKAFRSKFKIDLSAHLVNYLSHHYGLRNSMFFKLNRLFDTLYEEVVPPQKTEALVTRIKSILTMYDFAVTDSFVREGIAFRNLLFKTNNLTIEPYRNYLNLVVKHYLLVHGEQASVVLRKNFIEANAEATPSELRNTKNVASPYSSVAHTPTKHKFAAGISGGLADSTVAPATLPTNEKNDNKKKVDSAPNGSSQLSTDLKNSQIIHDSPPKIQQNFQFNQPAEPVTHATSASNGDISSDLTNQRLGARVPIQGACDWTPEILAALDQAIKSVAPSTKNIHLAYSHFIKLKTGKVVPVNDISRKLQTCPSTASKNDINQSSDKSTTNGTTNVSLTRGIKRSAPEDIVANIQKRLALAVSSKLNIVDSSKQFESLVYQMQISEYPNGYYEDLFDNLPRSSFWKFGMNKILVSTVQYLTTSHPEVETLTLEVARAQLPSVILLRLIRQENVSTSIDVIKNRLLKMMDHDIFSNSLTKFLQESLQKKA